MSLSHWCTLFQSNIILHNHAFHLSRYEYSPRKFTFFFNRACPQDLGSREQSDISRLDNPKQTACVSDRYEYERSYTSTQFTVSVPRWSSFFSTRPDLFVPGLSPPYVVNPVSSDEQLPAGNTVYDLLPSPYTPAFRRPQFALHGARTNFTNKLQVGSLSGSRPNWPWRKEMDKKSFFKIWRPWHKSIKKWNN